MGQNRKLNGIVSVVVFIAVVGTPQGFPLLAVFVGLHQAEARLLKTYKNMYVIVHYYGARREKHSMVTPIDVQGN